MSSVPKEVEINLPKEARQSFFFKIYIQLFTYVQVSSMSWVTGGSAEQPLQVPCGRALNQPRPDSSDKIV